MTVKVPVTGGGVESLTALNMTFDGGDPTGTAPEYELTATTAKATGSTTSGSWPGSYDATTKVAEPVTPTFALAGNGGGVTVTVGSFRLWGLYTVGTEKLLVDHGTVEFT